MKKNNVLSFLLILVICLSNFTVVTADAGISDHTPYQLTAVLLAADDTHPYGSAMLTFKIDALPGNTGDSTLTWYVNIEKKIGQGEWIGVSSIPSESFIAAHQTSPGVYSIEQLWVEDYSWDGTKTVSYRVFVSLDDLVSSRGGSSGYSNTAAIGLVSSSWAVPELQKAEGLGLIPSILKGADLTRPITREEFCELAVLLYEEVTGKASEAASPNPFMDTTNIRILKAFNLGITNGVTASTFEPATLINREQCAAMLFRAIKAINPVGNYITAGVKGFPDQKHISGWALDAAKYMAKLGIIKGDSTGCFMPKAITTAQTAAGYGMATREAAILMAVRSYESLDNPGTNPSGTITPLPSATATPTLAVTATPTLAVTATPTPAVSATPASDAGIPNEASASGIIGLWSYGGTNGTLVDPSTGYATGSIYNGEWYLFRSDGTFRYVLVSSGQIVSGGVVQEGEFTVDGGVIILTGIKESWYPNPAATGQKASYKGLIVEDRAVAFLLENNGSTLVIDGIDTFTKS
ncbi:MAG: S-layer homology domain-containing protein [Clostridiales bacterium]|nr:S-layer homology domain-containing protein [Clostridiales bacterium]